MARYLFSFTVLLLSLSTLRLEATASDDQTQFLSLMKKSLSGDLLSGWDATGSKPVCNYTGIECNSLGSVIKIDVSGWSLSGSFPEDVCTYFPELRILRLGHNYLHGKFPDSITSCSFLEELSMTSTNLTGTLPDLSPLISLKTLDLSNNYFTGDFPLSVTNLTNLEFLNFNENGGFNFWQLPENFSKLTKLKYMVLSTCKIQGRIPASIGNMTSLVDLELSGNFFTGLLFLRRWFSKKRAVIKHQDTFSSSYFSYDVKSFHRISFDHFEIMEAMVDKNIIDRGGSGVVYKIELSRGEIIAVKRLWRQATKDPCSDDQVVINKELRTEVETLGNIRHKNIIKLYCYFSSLDANLLVYEYMPNGNLWDSLHRGKFLLDWPSRHQIALDVAQGLAYLHHDLMPPIIHRDIKSTNILLDVNNHAKVADFGIAKVLRAQGGKDSTTTVIAGTYGYLAPEYAYSSKATSKCDVYSFGVVLMELITGKKPVEAEFGDNKNIIYWVSSKVETKEGVMEILDKQISGSLKDEIIKVLRIAVRCTSKSPALRPTMAEVVQLLLAADPCRVISCKSSNKPKDTDNVTKPPI